MGMFYLESDNTSPYFNLAMEEYVFNKLPKDRDYFMLWQNANSIIIGKHQNTIEEINLSFVREKNINVARRRSGGGAVYHDLGNLNFTFITDGNGTGQLDMASFCVPVVDALASMDCKAEISGRNDITIDGKKFSGNAQYISANRVMHHGTLMFDSNLTTLSDALKVSADKVESKGIKSIRSRVTNIKDHLGQKDMTTQDFKNVLKQFMFDENDMQEYKLTPEDIAEIRKIQVRYESWDWNYGHSPAYSIRKERRVDGCGKIQVFMEVEKGLIKDFTTRGDYFGAEESTAVDAAVVGAEINETSLNAALKDLDVGYYFKNLSAAQFIDIILQ